MGYFFFHYIYYILYSIFCFKTVLLLLLLFMLTTYLYGIAIRLDFRVRCSLYRLDQSFNYKLEITMVQEHNQRKKLQEENIKKN